MTEHIQPYFTTDHPDMNQLDAIQMNASNLNLNGNVETKLAKENNKIDFYHDQPWKRTLNLLDLLKGLIMQIKV